MNLISLNSKLIVKKKNRERDRESKKSLIIKKQIKARHTGAISIDISTELNQSLSHIKKLRIQTRQYQWCFPLFINPLQHTQNQLKSLFKHNNNNNNNNNTTARIL